MVAHIHLRRHVAAPVPTAADLDAAAQQALARVTDALDSAASRRAERARRRRQRYWPTGSSVLTTIGDAFTLPVSRPRD